MTHPTNLTDDDLLKQCAFGRSRSSGPGGQHRNKVETAVILTHQPTGIAGKASERRSQIDNKRVALKRLRLNLATQFRTPEQAQKPGPSRPSGPASGPSALWRSRRQGNRIVVSVNHHDFAALLAEALDAIATADWEPKDAAVSLGVSASQLIKFVKTHRPAFELWNRERLAQQKHILK